MKLNTKWFSISLMIVGASFFLIFFIWCSVNGFGAELVRIFESIHPSGGLSIYQNMGKSFVSLIPGILVDTVYAAVDFFVFGFAFSSIYNLFVSRSIKE